MSQVHLPYQVSYLRAESSPWVEAAEIRGIQSQEKFDLLLLGEDGESHTTRWWPRAESCPQLRAIKEMGTTVLQPQGRNSSNYRNELRRAPSAADKNTAGQNLDFSLSEEPGQAMLYFQPTEL